MNEFDLGWIIGFIECAGSFTKNTIIIAKNGKKYIYVTPQFFLTLSDPSAVETVQRLLRMGKITLGGRRLEIRRKEELLRFAELLSGRLKTDRRQREFESWARLLLQWKERGSRHTSE